MKIYEQLFKWTVTNELSEFIAAQYVMCKNCTSQEHISAGGSACFENWSVNAIIEKRKLPLPTCPGDSLVYPRVISALLHPCFTPIISLPRLFLRTALLTIVWGSLVKSLIVRWVRTVAQTLDRTTVIWPNLFVSASIRDPK
jgi:hypothetical protein